jgi:stage V sporulation protein G
VQITAIRLRKAPANETKLKAYASVVFDGMFVVHELRVVEGINGVFVAMPRRKTPTGEFKDLAHPITAEAREMIQKAILEAYQELEPKAESHPEHESEQLQESEEPVVI